MQDLINPARPAQRANYIMKTFKDYYEERAGGEEIIDRREFFTSIMAMLDDLASGLDSLNARLSALEKANNKDL